MRPPRRRARAVSSPPVAVVNALPLYRAMFDQLDEPSDSPTVVMHVSACETAVGDGLGEWVPRVCTCPEGSGFPRVIATVADGDGPVDNWAVK